MITEARCGTPASRSAPPTARPTTIALADGEHLVRSGIRCLVEMQDDFKVVGETSEGAQTLRLVERLKPRVLTVAVAMRGLNGLEVTRQVHQQSAGTAVIVLSRYSMEEYVIQALRNGASGYVVKSAKPAELVRAIRKVAAGQHYLSEPLRSTPIAAWLQRAKTAAPDTDEVLTPREREVLQLLSFGYTNARVARHLSISRRTAEAHRASIMRKLHLRNRLDLTRYIVSREPPAGTATELRGSPPSEGSRSR